MAGSVSKGIEADPHVETIVPGYDSEADYLHDMRISFSEDLDADRENRDAALEDMVFVAGEQWDETMKARRELDNKPCITVNRLPAFVGQVVGNRRLNETSIRVSPDVGGTKRVARVRQGLIRSIEKYSRADRAYNLAHQNSVICGIGNFGVSLEYAQNDVFDQDIKINPIPNALAVVWDRTSREPTGRDARHCYIVDSMPIQQFRDKYGEDATMGDLGYDLSFETDYVDQQWITATDVRVVSHWRMVYEERTLALMEDGNVIDITDDEDELYLETVQIDDDGNPYVRQSERSYAELVVATGTMILDGPYRLPLDRLPVFRVPGWEIDTAYSRQRFGLVRFAKDPQRMHNYWRSVIVEKLMLTPKAPWVAADTAVRGREAAWRDAHINSDTLLIYNAASGAPPRRSDPAQLEGALIQEANMATQDMRDVTNLHEASFGQASNEVSGKAIVARQRVGEIGTVIYNDNLEMAIAEAGEVINSLIPYVYDTARTVKIVEMSNGHEREDLVAINDVTNEDAVDITVGKYTVTTHTGPSYVTRRIEALEGMQNMVNAMPDTLAIAADLIIEEQEWPGAERIASRLRKANGHAHQDERNPDDMTAEERQELEQRQQQQAEIAEKQRELEELQRAEMEAKIMETRARAAESEARAIEATARANKARVEAGLAPIEVDIKQDKNSIDLVKVLFDGEKKEHEMSQAEIIDFKTAVTGT